MIARKRLPNRRGHLVVALRHGGIRCMAGLDRFTDRNFAEVFLSAGKQGTTASDAAAAVALLLQQGCRVEMLRRVLAHNTDLARSRESSVTRGRCGDAPLALRSAASRKTTGHND